MANPDEPKIITSSAEVYARSKVKDLEDYELVGVAAICGDYTDSVGGDKELESEARSILLDKAKKLGAEAIVDLKPSIACNERWFEIYMAGTAMVPKKR